MTDLENKKVFLSWLSRYVSFPLREIYWIINYLIEHDTILRQVHIVEHVEKTPRGLYLSSLPDETEPLFLKIQQQMFNDPLQIFHELRLNWKQPLYIGCSFDEMNQNSFYVGVLEDNPFYKWNDHTKNEVKESIESFLLYEEKTHEMKKLYALIDQALENNEKEKFKKLSETLQELKAEKKDQLFE